MQIRYLVEVSAKYSERANFQQLLKPMFVSERELKKLLKEYRVLDGQSAKFEDVYSFYSQERRYPFNRLLILHSDSNFGLAESVDKLLVNLCSFVRYPTSPPSVVHEFTANS